MMARSSVQRLLVAYTVDLISVLRELFDLTLQPDKALATTWQELKEAFEAYKRSPSCQHIHNRICSNSAQGEQNVAADDIRGKVREFGEGVLVKWRRFQNSFVDMTWLAKVT
jgi:hypothetical protein